MANDLTGNPWVIDTASATAVHSGLAFISGISWSNYANMADQLVIKDSRGVEIVNTTGKADLTPIIIGFGESIRVRDLTVTILDSGKVAVHHK